MPDWVLIATRRAAKVTDGLRLLANTARRDYDVDPVTARAMLAEIDEAAAALRAAYAPRLGEPVSDTPAPASPASGSQGSAAGDFRCYPPVERRGIARFVAEIPDEDLPAWAQHLTARIVDEAYARRSAS